MNLLRRIATLPGIRVVLLHPTVRKRLAAVLALRFAVAAWATTTPLILLRNEVSRRGLVETYRLRNSDMVVSLQHGRDLEALFELFVRGEYEPPASLAYRLTSPARIVDVGANVGMFSAWAAAKWPTAHITAFEPAPENVRVYRRWAERSGADVGLVEACATTSDGSLHFSEGRGGGDFADASGDLLVDGRDVLPVLAAADFVKIDIEGGEWEILGDSRLAELEDVVLVMEYHRRLAPTLPAYDAARSLLEAAGFEVGHQRANHWGHGTLWAWKS